LNTIEEHLHYRLKEILGVPIHNIITATNLLFNFSVSISIVVSKLPD